jgi:hypothetical protein
MAFSSWSPFSRTRTRQIDRQKKKTCNRVWPCRFSAAPFDNNEDLSTVIPRRNKGPPMKFAILGCSAEKNYAGMSKSEMEAMSDDCFAYVGTLLKEGHVINDGATLQPTCTAKTLRWQNGAVVVTDGPFAETKEQFGGLCVLEARNMDHAVEVILKHPALHHGAALEIRPVNEEALRSQAASINALRPGAPAVDPQAIRFASMGHINENGPQAGCKDKFGAMLAECKKFDEARVMNGQWLSGIGLRSVQTAKTLRVQEGEVIVTDGPFAETKEQLGGIVVLAFKDLNDAIASLSNHPALPFGVVIEIRPIHVEGTKRWETELGRVK